MLVTNIIRVGRLEDTRAALQAAALDLCERQGYDVTTVEQIAAAAGVTQMTFFRHFPTKAAVLMDDPYDPVIGELVAGQPAGLPALDRACGGVAKAWSLLPAPDRDDTWRRVRLVAGNPTLRAHMWENTEQTRVVVAEALTRGGTDVYQAQVAAGACMGALMAALLEWGRRDDISLGTLVTGALTQVCPRLAARTEEAS
jgi:AcrR family transcriptional regulator